MMDEVTTESIDGNSEETTYIYISDGKGFDEHLGTCELSVSDAESFMMSVYSHGDGTGQIVSLPDTAGNETLLETAAVMAGIEDTDTQEVVISSDNVAVCRTDLEPENAAVVVETQCQDVETPTIIVEYEEEELSNAKKGRILSKHTYEKSVYALPKDQYCSCSEEEKGEEIPVEQVFIRQGQMLRLPNVCIIRLGPLDFYAFFHDKDFYISTDIFLQLVGHQLKKLYMKAFKCCNGHHFLQIRENEFELLKQKCHLRSNVRFQTLVSLTAIREVSKFIEETTEKPLVTQLAHSIYYKKCPDGVVKCSSCALRVFKEIRPEIYLPLQLSETDKLAVEQVPQIETRNTPTEYYPPLASNKMLMCIVGILSFEGIGFTCIALQNQKYVSIKDIVCYRMFTLKELQLILNAVKYKPICAPQQVEDQFAKSLSPVRMTLWIELSTLRSICYMKKSKANVEEDDIDLFECMKQEKFIYMPKQSIEYEETIDLSSASLYKINQSSMQYSSRDCVAYSTKDVSFVIHGKGRRLGEKHLGVLQMSEYEITSTTVDADRGVTKEKLEMKPCANNENMPLSDDSDSKEVSLLSKKKKKKKVSKRRCKKTGDLLDGVTKCTLPPGEYLTKDLTKLINVLKMNDGSLPKETDTCEADQAIFALQQSIENESIFEEDADGDDFLSDETVPNTISTEENELDGNLYIHEELEDGGASEHNRVIVEQNNQPLTSFMFQNIDAAADANAGSAILYHNAGSDFASMPVSLVEETGNTNVDSADSRNLHLSQYSGQHNQKGTPATAVFQKQNEVKFTKLIKSPYSKEMSVVVQDSKSEIGMHSPSKGAVEDRLQSPKRSAFSQGSSVQKTPERTKATFPPESVTSLSAKKSLLTQNTNVPRTHVSTKILEFFEVLDTAKSKKEVNSTQNSKDHRSADSLLVESSENLRMKMKPKTIKSPKFVNPASTLDINEKSILRSKLLESDQLANEAYTPTNRNLKKVDRHKEHADIFKKSAVVSLTHLDSLIKSPEKEVEHIGAVGSEMVPASSKGDLGILPREKRKAKTAAENKIKSTILLLTEETHLSDSLAVPTGRLMAETKVDDQDSQSIKPSQETNHENINTMDPKTDSASSSVVIPSEASSTKEMFCPEKNESCPQSEELDGGLPVSPLGGQILNPNHMAKIFTKVAPIKDCPDAPLQFLATVATTAESGSDIEPDNHTLTPWQSAMLGKINGIRRAIGLGMLSFEGRVTDEDVQKKTGVVLDLLKKCVKFAIVKEVKGGKKIRAKEILPGASAFLPSLYTTGPDSMRKLRQDVFLTAATRLMNFHYGLDGATSSLTGSAAKQSLAASNSRHSPGIIRQAASTVEAGVSQRLGVQQHSSLILTSPDGQHVADENKPVTPRVMTVNSGSDKAENVAEFAKPDGESVKQVKPSVYLASDSPRYASILATSSRRTLEVAFDNGPEVEVKSQINKDATFEDISDGKNCSSNGQMTAVTDDVFDRSPVNKKERINLSKSVDRKQNVQQAATPIENTSNITNIRRSRGRPRKLTLVCDTPSVKSEVLPETSGENDTFIRDMRKSGRPRGRPRKTTLVCETPNFSSKVLPETSGENDTIIRDMRKSGKPRGRPRKMTLVCETPNGSSKVLLETSGEIASIIRDNRIPCKPRESPSKTKLVSDTPNINSEDFPKTNGENASIIRDNRKTGLPRGRPRKRKSISETLHISSDVLVLPETSCETGDNSSIIRDNRTTGSPRGRPSKRKSISETLHISSDVLVLPETSCETGENSSIIRDNRTTGSPRGRPSKRKSISETPYISNDVLPETSCETGENTSIIRDNIKTGTSRGRPSNRKSISETPHISSEVFPVTNGETDENARVIRDNRQSGSPRGRPSKRKSIPETTHVRSDVLPVTSGENDSIRRDKSETAKPRGRSRKHNVTPHDINELLPKASVGTSLPEKKKRRSKTYGTEDSSGDIVLKCSSEGEAENLSSQNIEAVDLDLIKIEGISVQKDISVGNNEIGTNSVQKDILVDIETFVASSSNKKKRSSKRVSDIGTGKYDIQKDWLHENLTEVKTPKPHEMKKVRRSNSGRSDNNLNLVQKGDQRKGGSGNMATSSPEKMANRSSKKKLVIRICKNSIQKDRVSKTGRLSFPYKKRINDNSVKLGNTCSPDSNNGDGVLETGKKVPEMSSLDRDKSRNEISAGVVCKNSIQKGDVLKAELCSPGQKKRKREKSLSNDNDEGILQKVGVSGDRGLKSPANKKRKTEKSNGNKTNGDVVMEINGNLREDASGANGNSGEDGKTSVTNYENVKKTFEGDGEKDENVSFVGIVKNCRVILRRIKILDEAVSLQDDS